MSPWKNPFTFITILIIYYNIYTSSSQRPNKYIITLGRPSNRSYTPTTQLCCNGIYHEKTNSYFSCCGNKTYNQKTHLCCGTTVTPRSSSAKCCFDVPYNSQTHNCDYLIVETRLIKKGLKVWTVDRQVKIVTPKVNAPFSTCGDKIINLNTHICCNQSIVATQPNFECCGNLVYNPEINYCCQFLIPPKILPLNKSMEDCIGKSIIEVNDTCIKDDNRHKCCGNSSYLPSEQVCCEGELIVKHGPLKCCFGSGPYDPLKDTCCRKYNFVTSDKKSRIYKDKISSCCYLSLYDESKESCCGISVIPKLPNNQSGCCVYKMNGNDALFDEFVSAYEPPLDEITSY